MKALSSPENVAHAAEIPLVRFTGNAATSVSHLDADAVPAGSDEAMVLSGRYEDEFIKDAGRWWLKKRKIIGYYARSGGKYVLGRGE